MKKNYVIKETVYTPFVEEKETVENVETLAEHVETAAEMKINILVNENKINENNMKAMVVKKDFRSLFGPGTKPHKGDVLSITGSQAKYKVKKSKKFSAKKQGGKGFKLNLQKIDQ